jgi:hypothetical protein
MVEIRRLWMRDDLRGDITETWGVHDGESCVSCIKLRASNEQLGDISGVQTGK